MSTTISTCLNSFITYVLISFLMYARFVPTNNNRIKNVPHSDVFYLNQDYEYPILSFLDLSDVDDNERTRLSSALLQLDNRNAPASLNDDAVQAQCRTTDEECRLTYNIQSNSNSNSSWPNHVANGKLSHLLWNIRISIKQIESQIHTNKLPSTK